MEEGQYNMYLTEEDADKRAAKAAGFGAVVGFVFGAMAMFSLCLYIGLKL